MDFYGLTFVKNNILKLTFVHNGFRFIGLLLLIIFFYPLYIKHVRGDKDINA